MTKQQHPLQKKKRPYLFYVTPYSFIFCYKGILDLCFLIF